MRVILFGATGMIGSGVLLECLADPRIESVVSVVRQASGVAHPKLRELIHEDFLDLVPVCADFAGVDACFYCLGISSAGMKEEDYRRVTYDFTMAAAKEVLAESPHATFCFVSGAGTDSSGRGRVMWARVKGQAEQALLAMPFKAAYMIRPAYIQPRHGVKSKARWTRWSYAAFGWLYPLWRLLAPSYVTTSDELARAMIQVAKHGAPKAILVTRDLRALAPPALPARAA